MICFSQCLGLMCCSFIVFSLLFPVVRSRWRLSFVPRSLVQLTCVSADARQGLVHGSFVVVHDRACVPTQFGYCLFGTLCSLVLGVFLFDLHSAKGACAFGRVSIGHFSGSSFSLRGRPPSVLHCPLGFWGHSAWPFLWLRGNFPKKKKKNQLGS